MAANGKDDKVQSAIDSLNQAIDRLTENIMEKLDTVANRIEGLKQSIKAQNQAQKDGNAKLLQLVKGAETEADRLDDQVDSIEDQMKKLPQAAQLAPNSGDPFKRGINAGDFTE